MPTVIYKKEKGKKQVDPEYVKSPIRSSNGNSRPSSTGSLKPFQKGGFLSLLLCCTVGAGSFLDNSDKSSINNKKNRHHKEKWQPNTDTKVAPPIPSSPSTTTTTTSPVTEQSEEIESSDHVDSNHLKNEHEDIPQSMTPTSSPGPQSEVSLYTYIRWSGMLILFIGSDCMVTTSIVQWR